MLFKKFCLLLFLLLGCLISGFSQTGSCPPNISFENGNFGNWQAATGKVNDVGINNIITMTGSGAVTDRHTIYDKTANPGTDPYGKFARVSPDGGRYSVRLGNNGIGAQAERLSYTLKVPANQPDFTLTYYYAVVFQDPKHDQHQQPRFTARVFDVAANQYIPCASFEYIATSNLPGFTKSTAGSSIYYKDWSPVTINLSEYSGKEIKLEFTSADCTEGGHFGYAYVDVSDECLGAITGNTYCGNQSSITLKGPSGFQTYNWYDSNLKNLIGSGQSLNISPAPPNNARYALQVIPYPGFGCLDTVYTTIQQLTLNFILTPPAPVCAPLTVDITDARLVSNGQGLTFSYWMDASGTIPITNPKALSASGTYYIKGLSATNCETIRPITVTIYKQPAFTLKTPQPVYFPSTVDITTLVKTADKNLSYRYSYTSDGSSPITQPDKVDVTGTYYIIGTNENGCELALPVFAKIVPRPSVFVPTAFTPLLPTNSHLFPFLKDVKTLLNFKIYNKWGNLVFQTSEANPGWDGMYKSEMHFFETYTWYLDGIDELDNYFKTTGKSVLIK